MVAQVAPLVTLPNEDRDERVMRFVEDFALAVESEGLPRMAGRIFAYLAVCQPPERTAAELRRELHASAGSVSSMTRLLVGAALIDRVSRRGQRADQFRMNPEDLTSLMHAATGRMRTYVRLIERGMDAMSDRTPAERARITELHGLYKFFLGEMPRLVEEWEAQRKELTT